MKIMLSMCVNSQYSHVMKILEIKFKIKITIQVLLIGFC